MKPKAILLFSACVAFDAGIAAGMQFITTIQDEVWMVRESLDRADKVVAADGDLENAARKLASSLDTPERLGESGKWELAAKAVAAARGRALFLRKLAEPFSFYAPIYDEMLDAILSGTNRVYGLSFESSTNRFATIQSIFSVLPPRTGEEPNIVETWPMSADDIENGLSWLSRERDWLTNYVATAGGSFDFAVIRDRMETHLRRVEEVREAAREIPLLVACAEARHHNLCRLYFTTEYAHATNQLAKGKFDNSVTYLFPVERALESMNHDGHYDAFLRLIEEARIERERQRYAYCFDRAMKSPVQLRKAPTPSLSPEEKDLERANDLVEYARRNLKKADLKEALFYCPVAREAIARRLPNGEDGEQTSIQLQFRKLLEELDSVESACLSGELKQAEYWLETGEFRRGRVALECVRLLVGFVDQEDRHADILHHIEELMEELTRKPTRSN